MSSGLPARAGLYWRTLRHLRPEQVVHRIRLRARQEGLRRRPELFERRWTPTAGDRPPSWPTGFRAVDAESPPYRGSLEDLALGTFTFLEERRELGRPVAWDPEGVTQLWLYHSHYWEWAWSLAAQGDEEARDVFADHWRSWRDATRFGRWNAWAPYPTSLRAWVLVNTFDALAAGSPVERDVVDQLRLHAGFVAHNLELDVGGNHLVKNLKALLGLGVFLDRRGLVDEATRRLRHEVEVQVLPDGGHYERSPSYHCQVLGDLLDVAGLLAEAGHPPVPGLDDAIARMRDWLGSMILPDGDIALFNDAELVGADRLAVLSPTPAPDRPLHVLADSGYVVARSAGLHLVVDVGDPCPPDLPAHAHADCLSFELAVHGVRAVVDPGTSVYGSGPRRQHERSTRAHSTVTIDDTDQTEVWGGFRAGRLAHGRLVSATVHDGLVEVVGEHDGYRHLPGAPVHRRRWALCDGELVVDDVVTGSGTHDVAVHLLLADDTAADRPIDLESANAVEVAGLVVVAPRLGSGPERPAASVDRSEHAVGFGRVRPSTSIRVAGRVPLPASWRTTLRVDPDRSSEPLQERADGPIFHQDRSRSDDPPM